MDNADHPASDTRVHQKERRRNPTPPAERSGLGPTLIMLGVLSALAVTAT